MSPIPTATKAVVLVMKYGTAIKQSPQMSGTNDFCLLP